MYYHINATADRDAAKIAVGLHLMRENKGALNPDRAIELAAEFVENSKPGMIIREGDKTASFSYYESLDGCCHVAENRFFTTV